MGQTSHRRWTVSILSTQLKGWSKPYQAPYGHEFLGFCLSFYDPSWMPLSYVLSSVISALWVLLFPSLAVGKSSMRRGMLLMSFTLLFIVSIIPCPFWGKWTENTYLELSKKLWNYSWSCGTLRWFLFLAEVRFTAETWLWQWKGWDLSFLLSISSFHCPRLFVLSVFRSSWKKGNKTLWDVWNVGFVKLSLCGRNTVLKYQVWFSECMRYQGPRHHQICPDGDTGIQLSFHSHVNTKQLFNKPFWIQLQSMETKIKNQIMKEKY